MSVSSASKLESSLISLAGSSSTSTGQGGFKRKRRCQEGWGMIIWGTRLFLIFPFRWGGGGGNYSREAITGGAAIIQGNTVYGYAPINREYCLFLSDCGTWYKNHSLSLEVGDISLHLDRLIFPQNPWLFSTDLSTLFFFNFWHGQATENPSTLLERAPVN